MQVQEENSYDSYKDVDKGPVVNYFSSILENFQPKKKKILLFVQCSKQKPYSDSLSHGYIRRAISQVTGYDPYDFPEKNPIQIVVISSLVGPVPSQFETDPIPSNYDLSVNKISNQEFEIIKPILVERIIKFIKKFKKNYENIVFFVKNNYRELCEAVLKKMNSSYKIIPKKDLHMIREAWIELKFVLLNILKEEITLQPLPKKILTRILEIKSLPNSSFTINAFKKMFNLEKTDKQAYNYLLTLRILEIIKKKDQNYIFKENIIDYLQSKKKRLKEEENPKIDILREYIFKNSLIKYNLRFIIFQIYKNSEITSKKLSDVMKINQFSMGIYLQFLKWLNLIKQKGNSYFLKRNSKKYLNRFKYLKLIDKKPRIHKY